MTSIYNAPEYVHVLIVGAGPAGLATAISLGQHGTESILVVDAHDSAGQNGSRAILIHSGTIEELHTIGCASTLIHRATKTDHITFRTAQDILFSVDVSQILAEHSAAFPFALCVSQEETEDVLEKRLNELGISIARGRKLVSLEASADDLIVARFQSGHVVKAKYLIGADGAHSTVRQNLKVPFVDPKNGLFERPEEQAWMVADIQLTAGAAIPSDILREKEAASILGPLGFMVLVPLPFKVDEKGEGSRIYRIVSTATKDIVTKEELQRVLDMTLDVSQRNVPTIADVLWSSNFRVRSAVADHFIKSIGGRGTVVLVGDAAHVHSPGGGQGMNLGIRDAIQLGRTLDIALKSTDPTHAEAAAALDKFAKERRERAIQVIRMTKVFNLAWGTKSAAGKKVRNGVFWLSGKIPWMREQVVLRLSGIESKKRAGVWGLTGAQLLLVIVMIILVISLLSWYMYCSR